MRVNAEGIKPILQWDGGDFKRGDELDSSGERYVRCRLGAETGLSPS